MTKDTPTPVPFINLVAQYQRINDEVQATVLKVFEDQAFVLGDEVAEFECDIAEYCDSRNAIGVASGTDALLLALMALEIGPGDEVITSPFTFFATGSSIARVGATPVFADIDPVSYNLCPESIESKITERTKAIMPVHIFGQCADMEPIWRNAVRNGIPVIEDAAQAIGAEYRGRRSGVLGTLGCFSFFPTKNLGGAGDGGLVTTDDPDLATRVRRLRVHGDLGGYQHAEVGINSRLDALQAAVLRVKLKYLDQWTMERQENARRYNALLRHYQLLDCVEPPTILPDRRHVYNQYTVRVKGGQRDKVLQDLREKHIGCAIYYPRPLHMQQCFEYLGYQTGDLPETELVTSECLALPIFSELSEVQQEIVIRGIAESLGRLSSSKYPTLYSETPQNSKAA